MRQFLIAGTTLFHLGVAAAHEGHGPANPHWHASDLVGVALIAIVAGALFFWRRK
jgi:hypothetical protein